MALLDIKKQELKAWDLFRFVNGELIYYVYEEEWVLRYTAYSVETKYSFSIDILNPFQFEIIWTAKEWLGADYDDIAKRHWENKMQDFKLLDS